MNGTRAPLRWPLLLTALLALPAGPALLKSVGAGQEPSQVPASPVSGAPGAPTAPEARRFRELLDLYRLFFGLPTEPPAAPQGDETLPPVAEAAEAAAIADSAAAAGYRLGFVVALVPDPLDSNLAAKFDQAMQGIQAAYADSGYLLDRFWLPWAHESVADHPRHRQLPGALLFRREDDGEHGRGLETVLLVGETPKLGLHKEAFQTAIELVSSFPASVSPERQLEVVGPSFSGSAESLHLALLRAAGKPPASPTSAPSLASPPGLHFKVVTGTATARGLESILMAPAAGLDVDFCRTVVPDYAVLRRVLPFLEGELGWDLTRTAILREADTSYGLEFQRELRELGKENDPHGHQMIVDLQFPSGLSGYRTRFIEAEAARAGAAKAAPEIPRAALDLSLAENGESGKSGHPLDIVRDFSPLTANSKDLVISNLLSSISSQEVRYIGILATDVRDRLFLAKLIHTFSPDVVLFSFDNDLLDAHPQYGDAMDGMLVLSSTPLMTESPGWRKLLGQDGPDHPFRRQFSSEFEEGVFDAVRELLPDRLKALRHDPHLCDPPPATAETPTAWVAAVSNGSLWPIAGLPLDDPDHQSWRCAVAKRPELRCPASTPPKLTCACKLPSLRCACVKPPDSQTAPAPPAFGASPRRALLPLLAWLVVPALLAWWLWRVSGGRALLVGCDPGTTLGLLAGGCAVAFLFAGAVVINATLARSPSTQMILLAVLGASYGALFAGAPRQTPWSGSRARARLMRLARSAAILGFAALTALPLLLSSLWIRGGPFARELFAYRTTRLASGLSPALSAAILGGAFYAWILIEQKRRRLVARQAITWPLSGRCEPPILHCRSLAWPLRQLLRRTFPHSARFWSTLAVGLGAPTLYLLLEVQPVTEPRLYGKIFLLACAGALALCAVSLYRFAALWLTLRKILERLDYTRLIAAFARISPAVSWRPIKSFSWQLPTFHMLALSTAHLKSLAADGKADIRGGPRMVDELMEKVFEADRNGLLTEEAAARAQLNRRFSAAANALLSGSSAPDDAEQDFLAVRIVAYVRYVFAHMRSCLTAAMITALLLLAAVRTYAFEPKRLASMGIYGWLLAAVLLTCWVFVEMDRNATLSAIGNTHPGQVTFDRHFLGGLLTYGALPLLGLAATQFPQVGRLLAGWLNPLLRIVGSS